MVDFLVEDKFIDMIMYSGTLRLPQPALSGKQKAYSWMLLQKNSELVIYRKISPSNLRGSEYTFLGGINAYPVTATVNSSAGFQKKKTIANICQLLVVVILVPPPVLFYRFPLVLGVVFCLAIKRMSALLPSSFLLPLSSLHPFLILATGNWLC